MDTQTVTVSNYFDNIQTVFSSLLCMFFSIFPCLTHTTEVVSVFSSLTGWAVLLFLSPCCLIGINRDLIVLFHISSPSFKQTKSCVHEKKNIVKLSPPFQKPSSCHWVSTNKNEKNRDHYITNPNKAHVCRGKSLKISISIYHQVWSL